MTPLYFDNAKGGLTSRDGKLLECCCCEYCCGKFGTGGQNNPTILSGSLLQGIFGINGTGTIQYDFTDTSCPYPEFLSVASFYYLFATISNGNITYMTLVLYCPNFKDDQGFYEAFNLSSTDNYAEVGLSTCNSDTRYFLYGNTILTGGPCGHSFNAVFECSNGTTPTVSLWKVE